MAYRHRRDSGSKSWHSKKEKPFYGGVPRARAAFYRKKRYPIALIGLCLVLFFFFGRSARSQPTILVNDSVPSVAGDMQERNGQGDMKDSSDQETLTHRMKQDRVRNAFTESWTAYSKAAWGKDEFHPISKTGKNMVSGGMGWIIIDALDTMYLMGLTEYLATAKTWVLDTHTFDVDAEVNVFETTIRMLGGLLSIYHLTQDNAYLDKAKDLGDRLLGAYDTASGIPTASVNLKTKKAVVSHADGGASSTAEVSSLQLEMKFLSHALGDPKYGIAAERVMERLRRNKPAGGLVPIFVQPSSGSYQGSEIRLGSRGDSYYEYLAKQWLMSDDLQYKKDYEFAVAGIKKYLVAKSLPNGLTYVGEKHAGVDSPLSPKMDHLVCFLPGTLALGATRGLFVKDASKSTWWSAIQDEDMLLAEELTRSCYEMYNSTTTGLAPEIVYFNENKDNPSTSSNLPDIHIHDQDRHNLMRPETVESLFVMWRLTRDEKYREWAWTIFKSFEKYLHVDNGQGFTSLNNVMEDPPSQRDNMESFWLAETLKYLYLIFAEETDEKRLGLNEVILNTEAHIFPLLTQQTMDASETIPKWQAMQEKVEKKVDADFKRISEIPEEREARYQTLKKAYIDVKAHASRTKALNEGKSEAEAQSIEEAIRHVLADTVSIEQIVGMQEAADAAAAFQDNQPQKRMYIPSGNGGMGAKMGPKS